MRSRFLKWQCQIRQFAVRRRNGMPTLGMRPMVHLSDSNSYFGPVTVLIRHKKCQSITAQFKFISVKYQDPRERMQSALKLLSEIYYQFPEKFSDHLTAVFPLNSDYSSTILSSSLVTLSFREGGEKYKFPCKTNLLDSNDPAYQNSYWHNFLFNPSLPGKVDIIDFAPDWDLAARGNNENPLPQAIST